MEEQKNIIEQGNTQGKKEGLSDRMKEYEQNSLNITKVLPTQPFLVRLDGKCFSKFTKHLKKPFDKNFTKAMCLTTSDLLKEFGAITGYTHSDEITLIFKEAISKEDQSKGDKQVTHIYDGRVIKMLTLMSGYCSVRFNYHLGQIVNQENNKKLYKENQIELINSMKACFDSRIIVFPEDKEYEILNHMIWRSIQDCERNAVSTYSYYQFSINELHKKNKAQMIDMLKSRGINWETDVPLFMKHGIFIKKENVESFYNEEKVLRTQFFYKAFKIKFCDFYKQQIIDKKMWDISSEDEKLYTILSLDIDKDFIQTQQ